MGFRRGLNRSKQISFICDNLLGCLLPKSAPEQIIDLYSASSVIYIPMHTYIVLLSVVANTGLVKHENILDVLLCLLNMCTVTYIFEGLVFTRVTFILHLYIYTFLLINAFVCMRKI